MKTAWKTSLLVLGLVASGMMLGSAVADEEAPARERGPRGPRPEGREGRQGGPEQMLERVMRLDKDGDSEISEKEAAGTPLERMFADADGNGDGFLNKQELTKAMASRMGRGGERRGPGGPEGRPGMGDRPLFQVGKVLPPMVAERMNLSSEQNDKIKALEAEVRKRLTEILGEDKIKQLESMGNRGPRDGMGPGNRGPRDGEQRRSRGEGDGEGRRGGPRDGERRGPGPRDGDL